MSRLICKLFVIYVLVFAVGLKSEENDQFLKSFKIGLDNYTVFKKGELYAYLVPGNGVKFYTAEIPVSIVFQNKNVTVLRVTVPDSQHCAYGYHIIEHQGDSSMISVFLPTCVNPEEDFVYVDEQGELHINVKSEHAESIKSVFYKNGTLLVTSN